jgi:hypothetical protein
MSGKPLSEAEVADWLSKLDLPVPPPWQLKLATYVLNGGTLSLRRTRGC